MQTTIALFRETGILYGVQYGFRKKQSTVHAISDKMIFLFGSKFRFGQNWAIHIFKFLKVIRER